jgi:DNA-binding NarL/FixJ family response regulator
MIRRVIEENGFRVCAEADDAVEAIRAARATAPDVAILDIRMPGNGLHACAVIRFERPATCIVMLTISEDVSNVLAAMSAGASAYWLKGEDPMVIPQILRRALAGELIIANSLLKSLVMTWGSRDLRQRLRDYLPEGVSLSPREYEVIELLCEGLTTAEIAMRLFVADVTVRTHIAKIVHKLNAVDREDVKRMISKMSETANLDTRY